MDHLSAETQKSVEKYTLNELPPTERSEFELHMFDCPVCSDLVRQNFTLTENLKEVLLEEKQHRAEATQGELQRSGWRAWLTPQSFVPTLAALAMACTIGYQTLGSGGSEMAQVLPPIAALRPASRSASAPVIEVDRKIQRAVVVKLIADGLAEGAFQLQVDGSSRSAVRGIKTGDEPVVLELDGKSLTHGLHTLTLRSEIRTEDSPITYTFEVRDAR